MCIVSVFLTVILSILGVLCKDEKITQDPLVEVSNGEELKLSCSHPSVAANENVFWYRQFSNQGPRFLVQAYRGSKDMEEPRGVLIVADDRKSSVLSISRVALEDAAVYFCALGGTVVLSDLPAVQEAFLSSPALK